MDIGGGGRGGRRRGEAIAPWYLRAGPPPSLRGSPSESGTGQPHTGKNKGDSVRLDVAAVRCGGLEAAGDAELAQDVRHVHAGGFLADVEGSGDLGVGQTV